MLVETDAPDFPARPYLSGWILAEPARDPWQRAAYFALRREVFVREQGLFDHGDIDEHDDQALPLVAMATAAGVPEEVVGVVRVYQAAAGVYYGGRLAVTARYRRSREVGASLIRAAVGAARGLGARTFLATVQRDNVAYFEAQHFAPRQTLSILGRAHVLMEADLSAFSIPAWL
jgi:putative N-acetyltransferase (TIGR04045 family)